MTRQTGDITFLACGKWQHCRRIGLLANSAGERAGLKTVGKTVPQHTCMAGPPPTGMCDTDIPDRMPGGGWRLCGWRLCICLLPPPRRYMPLALKTAGCHWPPQQQTGCAAGFGSKLRPPGQPHPVIGRLVQTVIFNNHRRQPFGAQNILNCGKAACRAGRINNQQPPGINSQRGQPGRIQHPRPAHRRRRTPDDRPIAAGGQTANQCSRKSGQRPVMSRAATQHMNPPQRQTASKRRIKRINPQ